MNKQNFTPQSGNPLFRTKPKALLLVKMMVLLASLLFLLSASAQTGDDLAVKAAAAELSVVNAGAAYGNLTRPTTVNGTTVTWSSANEKLVAKGGEVTRPKDRKRHRCAARNHPERGRNGVKGFYHQRP